MDFRRGVALAGVTIAMAGVTPATAQAPGGVSVAVVPDRAAAPSTLRIEVPGTLPQLDRRPLQTLALNVRRGFRLDLRARPGRCTRSQAKALSCPEDSRIGRGRVRLTATFLGISHDYDVALGAFLGAPLVAGDMASLILTASEPSTGLRLAVPGRLRSLPDGPYGYELVIDGLDAPRSRIPPGATVDFRDLSFTAGGSRRM